MCGGRSASHTILLERTQLALKHRFAILLRVPCKDGQRRGVFRFVYFVSGRTSATSAPWGEECWTPPGVVALREECFLFVCIRGRLLLGASPVADQVSTRGLGVAPRRRRPLSKLRGCHLESVGNLTNVPVCAVSAIGRGTAREFRKDSNLSAGPFPGEKD